MTTLDDIMTEIRELRSQLERPSRPAKLLTTEEAADLADVAVDTIRRWVKEGKLTNRGRGKGLRFSVKDVEAMRGS